MLDINMEFRKGILFVRLGGDLSVNTYEQLDESLQRLVNNNNVRFITFNIAELTSIDSEGINTILKYSDALSRLSGKAFICYLDNDSIKNKINNSIIPYYMFEIKDELAAINYINLGGFL